MKASRPAILILTTHIGGGHLNLAQALKDMLETHYEVVIVDPQPNSVDRFYTPVSRHFLKFLDWQFTFVDNETTSLWLHRALTLFSCGRLLSIMEHIQPRLIITTHALLSYATARANERRRKRVPLVFQLTDLERLHMPWFTEKRASAYLAPTHEIFSQALTQGIDKSRLYLTGRPVRRQFLEVSPSMRSETLSALKFDPAVFTIFLQGGAKGSARVDRVIEVLLRAGMPMQIILAAGNNKSMASRYTGVKQVRVLSFTETIAPYMAAADVIAGKAGASFISEAFILEKPFIVTTFLPGQETPNLQFVEHHNLGWVCPETTAQKELFTRVASDPGIIAEKVNDIRAYKAWNMQANQDICPIIDQLLS
ncbi:MAG TPA: glycosyltransferase [Ktedonobacteraceae bacterium]|nr:glycosyltransferase [Ktedonobacteraceae bacterium]